MFPLQLYSDSLTHPPVMEGVVDFLSDLGLSVEFRGDFFDFLSLGAGEMAELESLLRRARVFDIERPVDFHGAPASSEPFEKELYDAFWVQRIFSRFFLGKHPGELAKNVFHAVITGRLLGTYGSRRYHARVIISGFPSFISTSGLVEGPARPREYYFLKAEFIRSGRDLAELDEAFRGKFIDYGDERITKIAGVYVLQPLLYNFSGKEFCENSKCTLFNSHWQKEVLDIQYPGSLCAECGGEIEKIAKGQ
ncbi:MAG: hypothetical protein OXF23_02375 [Candidatus Dadabacteria bacterium]|nr:hypothetical protein [Candidatus Dadabacteria bacterium]